jgi:hypothetical protein
MRAYLYRCFDDEGRLLYVEASTVLVRRMSFHKCYSE